MPESKRISAVVSTCGAIIGSAWVALVVAFVVSDREPHRGGFDMSQRVLAADPHGADARLEATSPPDHGTVYRPADPARVEPSFAPPAITHVRLSRHTGRGLFAGQGTPAARVVLLSAGRAIADTRVNVRGRWQIATALGALAGDHEFALEQRFDDTFAVSAVWRLFVPDAFHQTIDITTDQQAAFHLAAVMSDGDDVGSAASRRFDKFFREQSEGVDARGATTPAVDGQRIAQDSIVLEPAWRWLHDANRSYHRDVVDRIRRNGSKGWAAPASDQRPVPDRRANERAGVQPASPEPRRETRSQMPDERRPGSWPQWPEFVVTTGITDWFRTSRESYSDQIVPRLKGDAPDVRVARAREEPVRSETEGERRQREARERQREEQAVAKAERERREAEAQRTDAERQRREAEIEAGRIADERRLAAERARELAVERRRADELEAQKLADERRRVLERQAAEERLREAEMQRLAEERRLAALAAAKEQSEATEATARERQALERATEERRRLELEERAKAEAERLRLAAERARAQETERERVAALERQQGEEEAAALKRADLQRADQERQRNEQLAAERRRRQDELDRARRARLERDREQAAAEADRRRRAAEVAREQEQERQRLALAPTPPLPSARPKPPAGRSPRAVFDRFSLRDTAIAINRSGRPGRPSSGPSSGDQRTAAPTRDERDERRGDGGRRYVLRETSIELEARNTTNRDSGRTVRSDTDQQRLAEADPPARQTRRVVRGRSLSLRRLRRIAGRSTGRCVRQAGRRITPPGTYVVRRGDSLWKISRRHYRLGRYYRTIYRANPDRIRRADMIFPCQRFHLPRRR